ncbi:MAG: MmgE/PrpD family protein [Alphaproteobacteria bacterium]|nr:MmgE/PrpD family protein [Alphaproteobacteria bacterium]
MPDKLTEDLSGFASALTFDGLGPEPVHAAKQRLIDALGCAVGASDCGPAEIGRRLAAGESPGLHPGRVLFTGERHSLSTAAFINSAMIRNFDFNDRYPGGHPSDCLGAHLAHAGAAAVDGKAFLTAMAVSYEIFGRLNDAAQLSRQGWDQGYVISIATVAGMCNLLGLDRETTANAVGIAAASSVALRVTRSGELTPWKNAATPYAVRNAVFVALLAAEGMAGPPRPFEGRAGLFEKVTGPFEIAPFPGEGGPALMPRVQIKYWPIETNGQAAVWAALELRDKVAPEEVEEIEVFTSAFTRFEIGSEPEKWDPQTRETADHSLPYIFARAFVDGALTVASFDEGPVRDPALRPLMAKIKVTVDDTIEAVQAEKVIMRIAVRAKDGRVLMSEIVNPKGHPDNPMDDGDVEDKFTALAAPKIGAARCRGVLDRWWQADAAPDMAALIGLLDFEGAG